jgi:hypothetical protein
MQDTLPVKIDSVNVFVSAFGLRALKQNMVITDLCHFSTKKIIQLSCLTVH